MPSAAFTAKSRWGNFLQKFTVLRTAPRELWIIFAAYLLENIAYKLSSGQVLPGWLSLELGMGDEAKGITIGIWSALVTLFTVLVGSFTDAAGIRRTFLFGFVICLTGRIVMALAGVQWVALVVGLLPLAVGLALMTPVMAAAMKRYTTAAQRSVAFSLYYALMNLGFAIGARLFDYLRHVMGENGTWTMPGGYAEFSTYRVMILWSVAFTVPGLLLTWFFLRDGVEVTETGLQIAPQKPKNGPQENLLVTSARIFRGLWRQPMFFRFLMFMALIVGVKMIFFFMDYLIPDFAKREISIDAPFAQVSVMLNSLLILVLAPLCGVLTQKISAYRMISIGSLISALSVFLLAAPPAMFQPLANSWFGNLIVHQWLNVAGPVNPRYLSLFLFIVVMSVGEALWSPRLYEYAAAIAPKGKEASYMALTSLPYFFAKCGAGFLSGWMLANYCPASGLRNSTFMWFIVGCMALVTPLGTFVFRKHIQVHEDGR
jgi:MFS family permease